MITPREEFENILKYGSENNALDFKSEQYIFTKSKDEKKRSQLLKDILSMVNSWRSETGYIIVGVIEKDDKPNEIVDILEHPDDAQFQQFVRSKTKDPCTFLYEPRSIDGKTVGVFSFPVQKRPIFTIKDYGIINRNEVYVRRGSSNDIALPDEIANMGESRNRVSEQPNLSLSWLDAGDKSNYPTECSKQMNYLNISGEIPDFSRSTMYDLYLDNKHYYRELAAYLIAPKKYVPINILMRNLGSLEANNVTIKIRFPHSGTHLISRTEYPSKPTKDSSIINMDNIGIPLIYISKDNEDWIISWEVTKLHAGNEIDLTDELYLTVDHSVESYFRIEIFADGLSKPIAQELKMVLECQSTSVNWIDFNDSLIEQDLGYLL